MKLSDAILMGDSLKKPEPNYFLETDGSCGCALGGALLATTGNYHKRGMTITAALREQWPWLTEDIRAEIGWQFYNVAYGLMPLEQLVDYVRSIEPAEEPQIPEDDEISDVNPALEVYKNRL